MTSHTPSRSSHNDDLATNSVCRILASWIVVVSDNKTQAHQFRLQSSLALIGFGAVSSSIFIENGGLYIGVFVLISMIHIASTLDIHYLKQECAWKETIVFLDKKAAEISQSGLKSYQTKGKYIHHPDKIYKHFYDRLEGLSIHDFTTKMLRRVGYIVGISIGIFAGLKINPSDWEKWWSATKVGQEQSVSQLPPKLGKLLQ